MAELAPVLISALALGVALYGIFERRQAAFSTMRVRLTELLAQIAELDVAEAKYVDEHTDDDPTQPPAEYTPASVAQKRALLAYQALALAYRLQRASIGSSLQLTASENGALAYALTRCGDLAEARKSWQDSIVVTQGATPLVVASNHQGFANCLFEAGEAEAARQHYMAAIELYPDDTTGRYQAFQACLSWLGQERTLGDGGDPQVPVNLGARVAQSMPEFVRLQALSGLRRASTMTEYANGQFQEICLLDRAPTHVREVDG